MELIGCDFRKFSGTGSTWTLGEILQLLHFVLINAGICPWVKIVSADVYWQQVFPLILIYIVVTSLVLALRALTHYHHGPPAWTLNTMLCTLTVLCCSGNLVRIRALRAVNWISKERLMWGLVLGGLEREMPLLGLRCGAWSCSLTSRDSVGQGRDWQHQLSVLYVALCMMFVAAVDPVLCLVTWLSPVHSFHYGSGWLVIAGHHFKCWMKFLG